MNPEIRSAAHDARRIETLRQSRCRRLYLMPLPVVLWDELAPRASFAPFRLPLADRVAAQIAEEIGL